MNIIKYVINCASLMYGIYAAIFAIDTDKVGYYFLAGILCGFYVKLDELWRSE